MPLKYDPATKTVADMDRLKSVCDQLEKEMLKQQHRNIKELKELNKIDDAEAVSVDIQSRFNLLYRGILVVSEQGGGEKLLLSVAHELARIRMDIIDHINQVPEKTN